MTKEEILAELNGFRYGMDGFWVTAGAALVLIGVRDETSDIDLGCTSETADRLASDGIPYTVMDDGNRWFRFNAHLEVFENWLYDKVELLDGFPVMSLKGVREMKLRLGREKDLRDIERIDAFLSRKGSEPDDAKR